MQNGLTPDVVEGLTELRASLQATLSGEPRAAVSMLRGTIPDWRRASQYIDLGRPLASASADVCARFDTNTANDIHRLLITELALDLPRVFETRPLPQSVRAMYPGATERLLKFLAAPLTEAYSYPNEFFVKDLRFASGLSVPCGAQVVDLRASIGARSSLGVLRNRPTIGNAFAMMRHGEIGPWFRIHTEMRFLDDFNEPGWDRCYLRLAALLRGAPDVLGMAGTSWFYDPALLTISPRLGYLAQNPLSRGAFLVRGRTTDFDIKSATSKSDTRRKLYEEGKYVPVNYSVLWPREALIRWAESVERTPA